jgi:hypothetical protein
MECFDFCFIYFLLELGEFLMREETFVGRCPNLVIWERFKEPTDEIRGAVIAIKEELGSK